MLTSSFSIAEKEAKKLDKKKLPPVKHFFVGPSHLDVDLIMLTLLKLVILFPFIVNECLTFFAFEQKTAPSTVSATAVYRPPNKGY